MNQHLIRLRHTLRHQRRIASDQVRPNRLGCAVQRVRNRRKILRRLAGCTAHQCNWCHGDTLIDNRYPVLVLNLLSDCRQILRHGRDPVVDILIELF